ncbi:hypothetical protein EV693_10128 [Nicoletella semolina]|uniref:Uncharacterized protein n=1 Tax=Nicoletella semolina TaxID=271160 RepID=A0A4R2NCH2_9PAST|nr:hypothetical protein [Nicoletella semolina]TCP18764.1 hypothetical protein EV693_10128 [Nicoletella semolina]
MSIILLDGGMSRWGLVCRFRLWQRINVGWLIMGVWILYSNKQYHQKNHLNFG